MTEADRKALEALVALMPEFARDPSFLANLKTLLTPADIQTILAALPIIERLLRDAENEHSWPRRYHRRR